FASHQRHGFGAEAVSGLVQSLFATEPKIDTVQAFIDDQNTASLALIRRAGLRHTETIDDADFFDGKSRREYVFSIERA
ncbi:MAG: GNAT family protein, partial [Myxococcota bacterium]